MKLILPVIVVFFFSHAQSQQTTPRLEAYVAPGLFFEQLSNDELVPPHRQNHSRLGDVVSYAVQVATPMKNQRFTIKAGIGFAALQFK